VKCSAKAINSAGESPVTSQTGHTKIAGLFQVLCRLAINLSNDL